MLSPTQRITVINILNSTLGFGTKKKDDNYAHQCPFCSHHKRKLEIDIISQSWHCWVCDAKGKRIYNLLKKLDVSKSTLTEVKQIYGDTHYVHKKTAEPEIILQLPKEFVSLRVKPTGMNPLYLNVKAYATERGITNADIIKHNIGYCDGGSFSGRIIIPSYDNDNQLNYFIARTIYPDVSFVYKNPPVSKNIIAFENQINWNEPIVLCEGAFDALSIKRNVIPLFGKFISKKLKEAIFKHGVTDITFMLDEDAQKQALHYTNYYSKQGIKVTNIKPTGKDPSKMGFVSVNTLIKQQLETTYSDMVVQKLNNIQW
jgi:DNA primase